MRGGPAHYGKKLHVIQRSTERPGLLSPWAMEPTSSRPTSLLPHEMMLWGLVFLLQSPEAAGVMVSFGGGGNQKREAFFLSSLRFHRASLLNSSGDMANTLEKSSADRCLSSLIRSTPGGNLVRPLLVTTSIS